MAQKRMFDKTITNNDNFLEMPDSTQNLYFHLSMEADDDGFVDNWKSIMRMTGKKDDDLKLLIAKSFIIPFETGVIVIKHWRINNYLRKDRYHQTKYLKEKSLLKVQDNEEYELKNDTGIPMVDQLATENRIEKNRIEYIYSAFENEFETLWEQYPNKKGKNDALKHYIKWRKEGVTFEEVENGIKNYKEFIKQTKKETQYIKNGSTWFNQKCWEDEYELRPKQPERRII